MVDYLSTLTREANALRDGRQYQYAATVTLDANGGTEFVIRNDDGEFAFVDSLELVPDEQIAGVVAQGATIDTSGTAFNRINERMDGDTDPPLTVEYGGSYTPADDTIPHRSRSGGDPAGPETAGTDTPTAPAYLLPPGESLYYSVNDVSGNGGTVLMNIQISRSP